MTTVAEPSVEIQERDGAMRTLRRGLALSPELRRGLPGTVALALVSTAGTSSNQRCSIAARTTCRLCKRRSSDL